ncbi:MAG: XisH family protein [Anaerolineae bacterium]|nr:XisH family protein [Anaerolineae bacterium]
MPAKDIIHDAVKQALIKDGWIITHDPYTIRLGSLRVFADLAAEYPIAAEKAGRKIAVEIKSFTGLSAIDDLEKAIGQYNLYGALLAETEPDRMLFLAVSDSTYANVFDTEAGRVVMTRLGLNVLVVTLATEEVVLWVPKTPIEM